MMQMALLVKNMEIPLYRGHFQFYQIANDAVSKQAYSHT